MSDDDLLDSEVEMEDGWDEEEDYDYESDHDVGAVVVRLLDSTTIELLNEDIMHAQVHMENPDLINVAPLGMKFTLPVVDMHPATRQACGLLNPEPLYVLFDVTKGYKRNSPLPLITVVHGAGAEASCPSTSSERPNFGFGIGLQLVNAIQHHLETAWKKRGENFVIDIYRLAQDRLLNCGNLCMLCDRELPFPGLKPTICDDKFCSYRMETLGLGAGLSLIDTDPQVADFLLCAAVAAASSGTRLAFALPNQPMKMGADEKIEARDMLAALNALPPIDELPSHEEQRSKALASAHPLLETILRWIFATNRAHITALTEEERFEDMKTPHQFKINTSTRAHAQAFETLKQRHGTFFAFHGSSTANWHNILRNNLKNASNTPMMSAGAAYGPGIYLAGSTRISIGYMNANNMGQSRWWNSKLEGSVRCIALCEVANAPQVQKHHQTGIIVASEESCVALRYLFVYTTSDTPIIEAKSLKPQEYRNDTTIVGMVPISEVDPKHLIVTSDGYAWDIQELVQLIESKHGIFINGYTRLGFVPADVKAIMNHSSGEGRRLALLEATNAALRKQIPHHVFSTLNQVGAICIAEVGEDYSKSTQAIVELKEFIEKLPGFVKDALDRAPFEVIDRHSHLPFRDTVAHEIELVTSAGDCIHRFGDFLCQVRP